MALPQVRMRAPDSVLVGVSEVPSPLVGWVVDVSRLVAVVLVPVALVGVVRCRCHIKPSQFL